MELKKFGAVLFLIFFTCLFFNHAILSNKLFLSHDLLSFHYPVKAFYARAIKQFDLPLWFPGAGCGVPILAEGQGGYFYPLNLLFFFLLPLDTAFKYIIIVHFLLAAFFMFLFMQSLGRTASASILSAIVYAWSGFFVTHLFHMNFVLIGAWLPLLFFSIHRFFQRGKYSYCILAILALSFVYLAGHPQLALTTLSAVLLFYLYEIFTSGRGGNRGEKAVARIGPLFLLLILPIMLAAVQILPTFELFMQTGRAHPEPSFAAEGSFHPLQFMTFLFPDIFGKVRPADVPGYGFVSPSYWGTGGAYWEMCGYAGVTTLILVFFLLFVRRERYTGFFILLLLLSVILMTGKYSPLFSLLQKVPFFTSFRFPARFLYLVNFSLSVLAGFSLDAVADNIHRAKQNFFKILLIAGCIFLVAMAGTHFFLRWQEDTLLQRGRQAAEERIKNLPEHSLQANRYEGKIQKIYASLIRKTNPVSRDFLPPLFWYLATLALFYLAQKEMVKRWIFRSGICLVIALDLFFFGHNYNPVSPSPLSSPPPAARSVLKDRGLFRILPVDRRVPPEREIEALKAIYGSIYGLQYLFFPSPLLMRENRQLVEASGGALHPFLAEEKISRIRDNLHLLGMMNVKYLISFTEIKDADLVKIFDRGIYVYQNRKALPRVFFASSAKYMDREEILPALLDPSFDPTETVLLSERPPLAASSSGAGTGDVRVLTYAPKHIVLETRNDSNAYLFLSDNDYPGWSARVDGEEVEIYRANLSFRAIHLPAGEHQVDFRYNPGSFVIGRALSGFSFLLLFVIFFYPVTHARQKNQW